MAGQDVDAARTSEVAADPRAASAFRTAVVAATRAPDDGARRDALRNAAAAAISLATAGDAAELRSLLTPDPVNSNVTWTVACYQIGDLTPSAVRDFADAAEAVRTVAHCDDAGHVAAELVSSTSQGLRWVALVRTNTTAQLRLPDNDATSDSTGQHATELGDAQRRWRRRIAAWAEGVDPEEGIDLTAFAAGAPAAPRPSASSSPAPSAPAPVATPADPAAIAGLREQVGSVERQLVRLDTLLTGGFGNDEERAGRLHALLAEVEARLVDASLDTRSGLASVEHRLGERVAAVRDTVVRGLDAASAGTAATRELVEARTSGLAESLRAGVQQLTDRLAANEAQLTELGRGLEGLVGRIEALDARAQSTPEAVRSAVHRDLVELSDHLDAGHGLLDRRRRRDHEQLAARVDQQALVAGAAVDAAAARATELRDAVDATAAVVDAAAADLRSTIATTATAGVERTLEAIAELAGATDATAEAATTRTTAATAAVLEAIDALAAGRSTSDQTLLAAIADVAAVHGTSAELVLDAIGALTTGTTTRHEQLGAAIEAVAESQGTTTEQVVAAVAEVAASVGANGEQVLGALARLDERVELDGSASATRAVEADTARQAEAAELRTTIADALAAATAEVLAGQASGADRVGVDLAAIRTALAELATAVDEGHDNGAATEQVLAAIAALAEAQGTTAEQVLAAIDDAGAVHAAGNTHVVGAVVEAVGGLGASNAQLLHEAVARIDAARAADARAVSTAIERLRAAQANRADAITTAVEQLSLDLTGPMHDAAHTATTSQRRIATDLERLRADLLADAGLTRGAVDGAATGGAAKVVREVLAHLGRADAETRQRVHADAEVQQSLLAAVERLHDRIDELEASQRSLRQSLVGP